MIAKTPPWFVMAAMEEQELPPISQNDMEWIDGETDVPAMARKVRAVAAEGQTQEALERELNTLKMNAHAAQTNRLLMSGVFWSALCPEALGQKALAAAKQHGDSTRGVSRHNKGPPHPHVWLAFLRSVLLEAKKNNDLEGETGAAIQVIQEYVDAYVKVPAQHMYFISQARVKVIKDEKVVVNWALSRLLEAPHRVDQALMRVLGMLKCDVRAGTAAASPIERQNQVYIEKLNIALGKGQGKGKRA